MLSQLYKVAKCVVVTLIAVIYPILAILSFVLLHVLTYLAIKYRQCHSRVNGLDVGSFIAPDDLFTSPSATLVHLHMLETTPSPEVVVRSFESVYSRLNPQGEREYAKLGYTLDPWLGYVFWKEIPNFQIKDRVHFIQVAQEMLSSTCSEFVESIMRRPFRKGEPLWEVYILSPKTELELQNNDAMNVPCFVVFRTHHLLLDGMSLIKLWSVMDNNGKDNDFSGVTIGRQLCNASASVSLKVEALPRWRQFLRKWILVWWRAPFAFYFHPRDTNCLTGPNNKEAKNANWWVSGVNNGFYLESYRQPLRNMGFSLTDALLVGYTRGVRRYIHESHGRDKIPDLVHIMGSVPRPNYPDGESLTNHWAIMSYTADMSIQEEVMSLEIHRQLTYAKHEYARAVQDIFPEAFELAYSNWFGQFPKWLSNFFFNPAKIGTLNLSNIAGPSKPQKMFGIPVKDKTMWLPLTRHSSGIGLLLLTYNGWGSLSVTADSQSIPTRRHFTLLNDSILKETQFVLDQVVRMDVDQKSCGKGTLGQDEIAIVADLVKDVENVSLTPMVVRDHRRGGGNSSNKNNELQEVKVV